MENFIKGFRREADGSWVCVAFTELRTVMGRIQVTEGARFTPGTIFMAMDICRLLDETQEALDRGARKRPPSR